jgi:hypothetical protein
MLDIFTTIAHHPKGFDLHIRNLNWAFDVPKRIHVFTFDWHNLNSLNVNFIRSKIYDNPENRHFNFHEHFMPDIIKNIQTDVILLIQQDIFFTEKVDALYEICKNDNKIVINNLSNYFSIFNCNKQIQYPRLWEGGIFYPSFIIKDAVDENINMGNNINVFNTNAYYDKYYSKLNKGYHHLLNGELIKISEFLKSHHKPYSEKLYELTLKCFCENINFLLVDKTVHFQGIEKIHRVVPEVYLDEKFLLNDNNKIAKQYINNCLYMYTLSDIYNFNDIKRHLFDNYNFYCQLKQKLKKIKKNYNHWMTKSEIEITNCFDNINFPTIL